MPEFVRVKHPVFGEYSTPYPGDDVEVLDKPALDQNGETIPGKPKTTVTTKAAAKTKNGDEPAGTPEEGSK